MQKEDAYEQMQGADGSTTEKKEVLQDVCTSYLILHNLRL